MAFRLLVTLTFVLTLEGKTTIVLDDVTALVGHRFEYVVGDSEFLSVYKMVKIVEKGVKKLPEWLEYDSNTSVLTGTPGLGDLGVYTMRMRADCIDPAVTFCHDRISRTFHIRVDEPIKSAESRAAPDLPPYVNKSIDHLDVMVGRYFQYNILKSMFLDKEDGNSRNLTLDISLVSGKTLPTDSWLMFDPEGQMLYGIPFENDATGNRSRSVIKRFILTATDSQGQSAKDVISITYKFQTKVTHKIFLNLNSSLHFSLNSLQAYRSYLIQVAYTLAKFYNDSDLRHFTFFEPSEGSLMFPFLWGNNSLFTNICKRQEIEFLFNQIVHKNDSVTKLFSSHFPDDPPTSAELFYVGVCLSSTTTVPPPTPAPATEKAWIEIVLPALIAILVIVIIAILLLICCRHRRPSKRVPDSDKPMFLEDRRPIIFPEELEMLDPSMKPKGPLVLPADYLQETLPEVPPHGRPSPPYRAAPSTEEGPPVPPHHSFGGPLPQDALSDPPPYRLPPPYFNPHRLS
ncbi:dystroglycan 1-like isoform X2 [Mya arenaria]|uniref:dystroglycan 1-like isoform X2 n=1 Tax=Mya arenaria TaxID=6604 RepID=UPI0022E23490|nr:dystroglycan 1-like isoform X2 [Mya arenaria]